ncbi:MAG: hypothetical protein MK130_07125, partial [Puniceicoccaceae bacterium]|nr:hypothetical protein [Puniceicoccaceae bacterium]
MSSSGSSSAVQKGCNPLGDNVGREYLPASGGFGGKCTPSSPSSSAWQTDPGGRGESLPAG